MCYLILIEPSKYGEICNRAFNTRTVATPAICANLKDYHLSLYSEEKAKGSCAFNSARVRSRYSSFLLRTIKLTLVYIKVQLSTFEVSFAHHICLIFDQRILDFL